jgi:hypothetical protein
MFLTNHLVKGLATPLAVKCLRHECWVCSLQFADCRGFVPLQSSPICNL